jgi:hypothetical protein
VAGAFDPLQVESLLAAAGTPADVHRLLLPGIKPSDLRLYSPPTASVSPDVVVSSSTRSISEPQLRA